MINLQRNYFIRFFDNLQFGLRVLPLRLWADMSRTLRSTRQKKLVALIVAERKAAGLTQTDVAKKLRRYQSVVANIESGQRRIDVVEFLEIAEAIGFKPGQLIEKL